VLLLSFMVLSALFFAFLAFLCFFDFVPAVSGFVSVLGEVPVSVEVPALPCAKAPNETRQKAASAAAIVRIM